MVVEVKGRKLESVVHAITHGNCGKIIEFDPQRYEAPGADEPVIERVEIFTGEKGSEESPGDASQIEKQIMDETQPD